MASETDWREAARGVPVEEEARVYVWWMDGWVRDVVRKIDAERGFFTGYRGGVAYGLHLAIPRLDHPSECAAYDRRLALALGAPERAVALGVVVYPSSVGVSLIGAGQVVAPDGYLRFEWFKELPACSDANLLRALAWPADKRVAG